MSHKQIRTGQLIAPFGPGSLYTDRRGVPHVVCGLDHWHSRWDPTEGSVPCEKPDEYARFEPRLAQLLRVDLFKIPPDYRPPRKGETPPPNSGLHIPAHRFPRWYRDSKTGRLRRFNLDSRRLDAPEGGGRWLPVRFIPVCAAGHLCEFPWKQWVGCSCEGDGNLYLTDMGGSELTSISVYCRSCDAVAGNSRKTLARVTQRPDKSLGEQGAFERAGIRCPGERPWLGEGANESCDETLVGALINQTNIYFSRTISAIQLPAVNEESGEIATLRQQIKDNAVAAVSAKLMWDFDMRPGAIAAVVASLSAQGIDAGSEQVESALESLFNSAGAVSAGEEAPSLPESEILGFRRAEYNILRQEINDPERARDLKIVATGVPAPLKNWITHVHLVERLKETRVFFGFDRLEPRANLLSGMPESAMHSALS